MALHDVATPGNELQVEGVEGSRPTKNQINHMLDKPQYDNPETATLKFNQLKKETQQQLHRCYHSKKVFFEQFAIGLRFSRNAIDLYLPIIIETQLCHNCNDNESNEYEKKVQENCDKINSYFVEINTYIQQHHQRILQMYKEQSEFQFQKNTKTALQIQLKSMKQELDALFTDCYEIIDSEQPNAPNIKVTNGAVGGLVIEILDRDKAPNDKYEIVLNDNIKKEFINDDNKQQYIELIDGVEPLNIYHITARRYISHKKRWSKYCAAVDIMADVKFSWSKRNRGRNATLSNLARDVRCKSKNGSCSIVADKAISSLQFKEVMFSFKMNSMGQYSYCGFVECSSNLSEFEQNMRSYWDALVVKNKDSYCLGFCDGSNTIQRWVNGAKKGKSKWTKDLKLQKGNKMQSGDVLLFHIDFDRMICDVYLNEKKKENKISAEMDQNTFTNVPRHIIPVYSHEHNPYIIAHSKVTIHLESYILRK